MKSIFFSFWCRIAAASILLAPVLAAHPGHYHPDETDEFDFLRAYFFHSRGALDWVLAAVVLVSISMAMVATTRNRRIAAAFTTIAALAVLLER